jgi:hypothetical protein
LPHVHDVIVALSQYATREKSAGRTSVLFTVSSETGVGVPVAESSLVEGARPKIGADSVAGRSERRGMRVKVCMAA